jgi:hypothetical protein
MMIKDILVTLPTGDTPSSALDYAVTVASTFDAHLTGVAFVQGLAAIASFDGATAAVPPLRVQESGSKKPDNEKAFPPNRWFSPQRRSGSLSSLHALHEGSI